MLKKKPTSTKNRKELPYSYKGHIYLKKNNLQTKQSKPKTNIILKSEIRNAFCLSAFGNDKNVHSPLLFNTAMKILICAVKWEKEIIYKDKRLDRA